MRSIEAKSMAPSGRNGVTAMVKTPRAVSSSMLRILYAMTEVQGDLAQRHGGCSLAGFDHGQAGGVFQWFTQVGHPGTAGDQDVGAVLVAQAPTGLDHGSECPVAVSQLQHAKAKRTVASEPVEHPMAPKARI